MVRQRGITKGRQLNTLTLLIRQVRFVTKVPKVSFPRSGVQAKMPDCKEETCTTMRRLLGNKIFCPGAQTFIPISEVIWR